MQLCKLKAAASASGLHARLQQRDGDALMFIWGLLLLLLLLLLTLV
jgi:hypothetical protein